ncbi:FAD-binding oxidoreductase, partial [Raoultella terrigena]|uniref:FAD-binding oxidoreductase n=1 Tax=Raoultella terrigena TaxID=577 RepID=UPI0021688A11
GELHVLTGVEADLAIELHDEAPGLLGDVLEDDDGPGEVLDGVDLHVLVDVEIGFNAGQYMKFTVPAAEVDGVAVGEVDRTWSIASPPGETTRLEFHIRNVAGGRGTDGWVFGGLAKGDEVRLSGPYGRFVLRTSDHLP